MAAIVLPRGRDPFKMGAEGATAPETLRQKDRVRSRNSGKQGGTVLPSPKG